MDFVATQICEDENFSFTQRVSYEKGEEESVQVGTLSIDGRDYQIKRGITKIGRLNSCDIFIDNVTVSNLHAEIEVSGGQGLAWICDLNSSNKTKLNDTILRPTRFYELKDGSVLKFGLVSATYRMYRPVDDTMIPETPAPSRQKTMSTIIPNTPDSSLSNSFIGVDSDGSVILGTQKDDRNCIFRRPQVLQQSTGISKRNSSSTSSMNESKDSQGIATMLHTSDTNVSDNQVDIFNAETQAFEEVYKTKSNSIHDMETQRFYTDRSERLIEVNTKAGKQLSKLNIRNKTTDRSVIHDKETQNYIDDISEMETQNIDNVTGKKFMTDIYAMETQVYVHDTDERGSGARKSETGNARIRRDIYDLETQKFGNEPIAKDISDMETQVETDGIASEISNNRAKEDEDKDGTANTVKDGTNHENVTKSPKSRSSSPGSLNLSSPGIEDCSSSPLNQSSHLLESSDLLEFFGEGIDKQERLRASNMSTPLTKVSLKKNSDMQNTVNNEKDNDEDIFNAPTQRINHNFEALLSDSETDKEDALTSKKLGKSRSESANDDSDTDAEEYITELAKKTRESLGTVNEPSNKDASNRNDPGTSVESEDIFDAQTQRLEDFTTNILNSSINQSHKINEINNAIDLAATQIISNVDNHTNTSAPDVNNKAPTHSILSHKTSPKTVINSKNFALKSNQNDTDVITARIVDGKSVDSCTKQNLDCEDADYELAPTQILSEIEEKRNSTREKGSSRVNLNDTIEQELNKMFDDVNNDMSNIHESPHMSTQYLEDILESSQRDDSVNKSKIDNRDTDNVLKKQSNKKSHAPRDSTPQHSHNLLSIEVSTNNVNKAKTESQESDVYFSTITTRRKRNVLRDTQELIDFIEDTNSHQINSSEVSKVSNKKAVDDSTTIESQEKKRKKRISKVENKSVTTMEILNDNNGKTVSNEKSFRSLRSKQKDEAVSQSSDRVLGKNPVKVDDTEENTSICTPCPLVYEQRAQTLDTLYESDDDILTRLPAVRMSGTLSNPPSPSASSTSTVRSIDLRPKLDNAKKKRKRGAPLKRKSLREQNLKNSEKNEPSIDNHSKPPSSTTDKMFDKISDKMSDLVDTSDDSDSETNKRFQQMANRMLSNELGCQKRQNKETRKNARISQDVSEEVGPNQEAESKNPKLLQAQTNSRMTRHSSRQNDKSSCDIQRETRAKSKTYGATSTKLETKSIITKRKISSNVIEESVELDTSKKRKTTQVTEKHMVSTRSQRSAKITTDTQSSNILEDSIKNRKDSSTIQNMKFSKDNKLSKIASEETQQTLNTRTEGNVDLGGSNVKRIGHTSQVTTHINDTIANESNKKNKPIQVKGTETQISQTQDKILRVVLSPMKSPANDSSQEVERIMASGPSNAKDRNLSLRKSNKAKIFQKQLRTRSGKQSNSDTETDSALTENVSSSISIEDSDNTQFDNSAPRRKRGRLPKSSVSSLPDAQVLKKQTFKKPTRIDQTSASSIFDSSVKNTMSSETEDSDNIQFDNSASRRKRGRLAKSSVPPLSKAQVSEKETFKKPTRINQTSANSILDLSVEYTANVSSIESDASTSSRFSKSQVTSVKLKKMKLNKNTHKPIDDDASSSLNTSAESTSSLLSTPTRARRSASVLSNSTPSTIKHKILFTGLTEDYSKIVKALGGSKVEDSAKCTVLVTDKVRRTYKFLCALAKGIPIVAIDWLRDSEIAKRFLDWENYILKDPAAEAKFGFRLRKSLDKAKEKKMLDGYVVVLTPSVAPPPIEELKDMVLSCGGKALLRPPTKWPDRAVILSREEDLPNAKKFLAKAPNTVTIQSIEFILTGILRQETDFDKYKLK